MMFPVMETLQPRFLVNLLFRTPRRAIIEAVQVRETGQKLYRIIDPVNTELELVHIVGIEVNGGFLIGRKRAAGAEIEGNSPLCVRCRRVETRHQKNCQQASQALSSV